MTDQHFHTPRLRRLEICIPAGRIQVETVDGDESVVDLDGDEDLVGRTRVELHGDELSVAFDSKPRLVGLFGFGEFATGGRLDVRAQVPHGVAARLVTAAADMEVRGRLATLDAKSASGDMELIGEIECDATLKTVSGKVILDSVGGNLAVHTVSGNIATADVGGSVDTKSVSANVRIGSVRQGHVSFKSVSGSIEVDVVAGTSVDIDASSVSGELDSEIPLADAPQIGVRPTVVVRAQTVSGSFRVFRAA